MDIGHGLLVGLTSPMVLAFALGILAALLGSDLKFPNEIYILLTIYLLFAIGIKGGVKLEGVDLRQFWRPGLLALGLCAAIPLWSFFILHKLGRFSVVDAAALAAHYGSVSAVTFGQCLAFLDSVKIDHEAYLPALLAIMEVPAILIALYLANRYRSGGESGPPGKMAQIFRQLLTGKGVVLLVGGLAIGLITGKQGFEQVAPVFDVPFRGVLTFFLLELGLVTGRRLADLRQAGPFLAGFAVVMPLLHGILGVSLGYWCGMSMGGATVLGTLAASASYIAAPAAARVALPEASPALYLTAALAITFPFNVVVGIPLYYAYSRYLFGG
jgi:hypothetical protein